MATKREGKAKEEETKRFISDFRFQISVVTVSVTAPIEQTVDSRQVDRQADSRQPARQPADSI